MMSTVAEKPRHRQLLQCAKLVFAERGYHASSVSDIIECAGVARGTFYLYFDSKRSIFDEVLDELLEELDRCIPRIEIGAHAAPPMQQLRTNLERVLSLLLEDRHLVQILLYQAAGLDQECRHKLDGFYHTVLTRIESALRLGIAMGLVRPCNLPIAAAGILGGFQGILAQVAKQTEAEQELSEIVDELLEFGLRGVLKTSTPRL